MMKKYKIDEKTKKRRFIITVIVTALAMIVSGSYFSLMLSRVPNMHIVFYLVLGVSVLVVAYLTIWTLCASERHAHLAKILKRSYLICLSVGIAGFLTLQGLIVSGARSEDAKADCVIVLGAGLRNGVPSLVLISRLNAAIRYVETQGDIPIIVSGGLGRGETITEAEAMFRYLRSRGIDEHNIWKEEASTNTRENMTFSLALMEEMGLDAENTKVAIVSNEFHLFRAKVIAGKVGIDAVGIAAETPGLHLRVLYQIREAFALALEVVTVAI